jgi:anti-sigma factor RsiW
MKCDEVQPLQGAYLDSELDAKTTLEIQQHLTTCPDCARAFAAEAKLDARTMASLKHGQRTAALWEQIEQRVATARVDARPQPATRDARRVSRWRELLWPCPQAWAGLAAAWVVALAVNLATSGDAPKAEARRTAPPSRETRQALKQQRQLFAELGGVPETRAADPSGASAPQPRSQQRENLGKA